MKPVVKKVMSYFLQGLLALMPLFITVFLVSALFGFIEHRVGYFLFLIPEEYRTVKLITVFTELSAALLLFILIVFFGLTIKTLWGKIIVKKTLLSQYYSHKINWLQAVMSNSRMSISTTA